MLQLLSFLWESAQYGLRGSPAGWSCSRMLFGEIKKKPDVTSWEWNSDKLRQCEKAKCDRSKPFWKRGTDKMASLWKWLWHYCQLGYECWVVLFPSMDWPERRRLAWTSEKTPGLEQGWAAVAQQWHEKRGGLVQLLGKRSGLAICKRPRRLLAKDTWCFPRLGQCCWRTDRLAPDIHFESGRPKIHYRSGGANASQVPQTTVGESDYSMMSYNPIRDSTWLRWSQFAQRYLSLFLYSFNSRHQRFWKEPYRPNQNTKLSNLN